MTTLEIGGVNFRDLKGWFSKSNERRQNPGLKFDLSGVVEAELGLEGIKRMPELAQKRALLTLRRKIATETSRDIRREYNIKAGRVAKDLKVGYEGNRLRITGYFRGIGLRNFSARQTGAGVDYSIYKGKRSLRPHAFFVGLYRGKNPKGNEHVAIRTQPKRVMKAGTYVGKMREPLETQYGPTVAQMLRKGNRPQRLADFCIGVLRDESIRQMKSLAA